MSVNNLKLMISSVIAHAADDNKTMKPATKARNWKPENILKCVDRLTIDAAEK